jgi:hypothetical protein
LASPDEKTVFTTRIGASAPSFGLRYFGSIGRLFSMSCSSPEKRASFCVSASSRSVMKASKAAL